jgi:hypothetical protein
MNDKLSYLAYYVRKLRSIRQSDRKYLQECGFDEFLDFTVQIR